MERSGLALEEQILNFLYKSHTTPLTDCNLSPADLIFKFKARTNLSQLQRKTPESKQPNQLRESELEGKSNNKTDTSASQSERTWKLKTKKKAISSKNRAEHLQVNSENTKNTNVNVKKFKIGDLVYYFSPKSDVKWLKASILEQISPLVYKIKISHSNSIITAHLDSLKHNEEKIYTPNFNKPLDIVTSPQIDQNEQRLRRRSAAGSGLRRIPRVQYSGFSKI